MADHFTFLSWVRDGAAAAITQAEGSLDPGIPARAAVTVHLDVAGKSSTTPVDQTLTLYGAGDVQSLDLDEIIRVEPPPGSVAVEPHYVPLVEFRRPDLPWLFTPLQGADSTGKTLRPWLVLVVLPEDAGELVAGRGGLPPRLRCPLRELPDPYDSPAWAHAQIVDFEPGESVGDILTDEPERSRSRLLAARRLEPERRYRACLVPSFKAGAQAGLGVRPVDTLAFAWPSLAGSLAAGEQAPGDTVVELPVYHHWSFTTGPEGDFLSLVRRLSPTALGRVGVRDLRVDPVDGTQGEPAVLALGGALVADGHTDRAWDGELAEAFEQRLRQRFEEADGAQTPEVGSPLYGGWHAGLARPPGPGAQPRWLRELNVDPRLRVFAGLGVQTVQQFQDVLMASAWEQIGPVEEENRARRRAQLARDVSAGVVRRRLARMSEITLLQVTRPMHHAVGYSTGGEDTSVDEVIVESARSSAAVGSTLRRVSRPRGPIARHSAHARHARMLDAKILVNRLLLNDFTQNGGAQASGAARLGAASSRDVDQSQPVAAAAAPAGCVLLDDAVEEAEPKDIFILILAEEGSANFTVPSLQSQQDTFESVIAQGGPSAWLDESSAAGTPGMDTVAEIRRCFQAGIAFAAGDPVLAMTDPGLVSGPVVMNVSDASGAVLAALGPAGASPTARVAHRSAGPLEADDALAPVLAAPTFPWPMVDALRDCAPEFLLEAAALPQESIGLLQSHEAFVKAYLIGLNHGMAAELLWRGYPTDRRGTYFQRFWDRADDAAVDLEPLDELSGDLRLLDLTGADERLAIVVRGELLRRFPGLLVSAVAAQSGAQGRVPAPDGPRKDPIAQTRLAADTAFFAFDLTLDEARGVDGGPGWFVVFREPPTEVRFGLKSEAVGDGPPASLGDLAWPHLRRTDGVPSDYVSMLNPFMPIDFYYPSSNPELADPDRLYWRRNSAHLAGIFARGPASVAWHAAALFPAPAGAVGAGR